MKAQRRVERKGGKKVKFSLKNAEEVSAVLPPCSSPDLNKPCDLQVLQSTNEFRSIICVLLCRFKKQYRMMGRGLLTFPIKPGR